MSATAVSGRGSYAVAWSGTKLFFWGGLVNGGNSGTPGHYLNTGAIYDVATDTWTTLPTSGAPSARYGSTAVWTGSKFLVWGGVYYTGGGTNNYNDGALYDPITNTWSSMSSSGAPGGRYFHAAITTGTKMIVWGGINWTTSANFLNSGGVYDFASNTWGAMSGAGAPTARNGPVLNWLGNKMAVFGGANGSGVMSGGGLYDPVADTWSSFPAGNMPANTGFSAQTVVNDELVIWGGGTSTTVYYADGAFYSSATNKWRPLTTTRTLPALAQSSVAWNGKHLFVFGGIRNNVLQNDGQIYR